MFHPVLTLGQDDDLVGHVAEVGLGLLSGYEHSVRLTDVRGTDCGPEYLGLLARAKELDARYGLAGEQTMLNKLVVPLAVMVPEYSLWTERYTTGDSMCS